MFRMRERGAMDISLQINGIWLAAKDLALISVMINALFPTGDQVLGLRLIRWEL